MRPKRSGGTQDGPPFARESLALTRRPPLSCCQRRADGAETAAQREQPQTELNMGLAMLPIAIPRPRNS
jgi:hypothetical protein